jgi:hypothetical protein
VSLLYPLPETPAAVVRALVLEDLERITSFPQVLHAPMEDVRNRAHVKQQNRRFDDEARITAMGDLA